MQSSESTVGNPHLDMLSQGPQPPDPAGLRKTPRAKPKDPQVFYFSNYLAIWSLSFLKVPLGGVLVGSGAIASSFRE